MNKARLIVLAALAVALAATLAWGSRGLHAQPYPPPVGSLTVSAAPTPALIGSSVTVSAVVRDVAGNPSPNQQVVFIITDQPGTDASLEGALSVTKTSDDEGIARAQLFTGSTPGVIIVEITSGAMTSQASVTVETEEAPEVVPPTGGARPGDAGPPASLIALAAAGGVLALAGALIAVRRRVRV